MACDEGDIAEIINIPEEYNTKILRPENYIADVNDFGECIIICERKG